MNFLAHAYLSFGSPGILTGNMISDFVKGKRRYDFPADIQAGITLHRKIDTYTDQHLVNRELKHLYKADFGLYSAAIMDVVHDHFLAADNERFSEESLYDFAHQTYDLLDPLCQWFPERFSRMFPYMKSQNWLYHYRFMEGLHNSLGGLARRAQYMPDITTAVNITLREYETIAAGHRAFFPDLLDMAKETFHQLTGSGPA